MHSEWLRHAETALTAAGIVLASAALLCGTQIEFTKGHLRSKGPSGRPRLPDPAAMTPRGRLYYRRVAQFFAFAFLCALLSWLAKGFYSNAP